MSSLPVLVVGAGPSGLVTALSLLQNNVPVRIVDKRAGPGVGWKGAGLQPRSLELYRLLDIFPEVWEKSYPVPMGKRFDLDSGTEADFHISAPVKPHPSQPVLSPRFLDQSHHEALLRSYLEKLSCFVEFGTALEGVEQRDDLVMAQLVKSTGERMDTAFSYVVGADGGRGVTRRLLGLKFFGDTLATRGIFADVRIEEGLDRDVWHLWGSKTRALTAASLCYSGHGNTFGFFYLAKSEDNLPDSPEGVLQAFHSETGRTDIKFGGFDTFNDWTPNVRMVEQFGQGRVFLVGAHIHSPTGGQGMNSCIQDAHNLAWKIALCHHGDANSSLLSSYDSERRPVITQMLAATTVLLKATTDGDSTAFERSDGYLRMLGVNYRGSPIVLDERNPQITSQGNDFYETHDGLVCAGDRAPEAPGLDVVECSQHPHHGNQAHAKQLSLFDLFRGTRHVILAFGVNEETVKAIRALVDRTLARMPPMVVAVVTKDPNSGVVRVGCSGADLVVQDTQGYAHAHYGVDPEQLDETLFIVRPDGAIGGVVTSGVAGIERYLETLFGKQGTAL